MLITKYKADDTSVNWLENDIQAHIVQHLRRVGYLFSVGMEGIKLSRGQSMKAKVLGMEAGCPDLSVYLPQGKIVFIELKRFKGVVSQAQKDRHAKLRAMGYVVHVVKERTPADALNRVVTILDMEEV